VFRNLRSLPVLVIFALSATAHAQASPRTDAVIDWEHNQIFLDAEWRLTGRLLQASNAELREKMRAAMLTKLSAVIAALWQKSAHEGLPELTQHGELAAFWEKQRLDTFQIAENRASGRMKIMLRGRDSVMAHLPLPFARELANQAATEVLSSAYDKRAAMGEYDNSQGEALLYTGLVIDARHLAYKPSLNAGVFTGSGRQIYGVEYLTRITAVKRGVTGFIAGESSALRQRAGKRPLRVSALDMSGPGENALVISDEDAAKLTAHTGSVQNLRRARVVVIVNAETLREKF